jgi:hypothetical protein
LYTDLYNLLNIQIGNIKSCTQEDHDGSLEDTYQELLPLVPQGFELMYHAEGMDHEILTDRGKCA